MRDLTDKERELAPDCCDMYFINRSDLAVYVNSKTKECHVAWMSAPVVLDRIHYGYAVMRPIKPFDITQHEWSDDNMDRAISSSDVITLDFFDSALSVALSKSDVVAIAKHFKLTAEDLK